MTWNVDTATAGIDWLTATVTEKQMCFRMQELADHASNKLIQRGNFLRPWQFRGYRGWSVAGLRFGRRDDGCICIVSGEEARLGWSEVLHYASNVSRVDLALTFLLKVPYPNVAKIVFEYLRELKKQGCLTNRGFSWVENHEGSETLYIGSRRSRAYGRVYDKGLQSGAFEEPGCAWRYEVEFKRDVASAVAKSLYSDHLKDVDVNKRIASTVNDWFVSRYVPCGGEFWVKPYDVEVAARVVDTEATLRWLSVQVSPSVRRLFGANIDEQRIYDALGLPREKK